MIANCSTGPALSTTSPDAVPATPGSVVVKLNVYVPTTPAIPKFTNVATPLRFVNTVASPDVVPLGPDATAAVTGTPA